MNPIISTIWFIVLGVVSVISFITFAVDKSKAKKGAPRIKEKTLLGLTVFGGAIGSFLGRIAFHHKTEKIYFSLVICISMFTQIAATVIIVCKMIGVIK